MCKKYIKKKHRRQRLGEAEKYGDGNPYIFTKKHFSTMIKSDHDEVELNN